MGTANVEKWTEETSVTSAVLRSNMATTLPIMKQQYDLTKFDVNQQELISDAVYLLESFYFGMGLICKYSTEKGDFNQFLDDKLGNYRKQSVQSLQEAKRLDNTELPIKNSHEVLRKVNSLLNNIPLLSDLTSSSP